MRISNMPVVMGLKATGLCGSHPVVLEVYVASATKDGEVVADFAQWCDRVAEVLCTVASG